MIFCVERETEDIQIVIAVLAFAQTRPMMVAATASCSSTQRLATFDNETPCFFAISEAARRTA